MSHSVITCAAVKAFLTLWDRVIKERAREFSSFNTTVSVCRERDEARKARGWSQMSRTKVQDDNVKFLSPLYFFTAAAHVRRSQRICERKFFSSEFGELSGSLWQSLLLKKKLSLLNFSILKNTLKIFILKENSKKKKLRSSLHGATFTRLSKICLE